MNIADLEARQRAVRTLIVEFLLLLVLAAGIYAFVREQHYVKLYISATRVINAGFESPAFVKAQEIYHQKALLCHRAGISLVLLYFVRLIIGVISWFTNKK